MKTWLNSRHLIVITTMMGLTWYGCGQTVMVIQYINARHAGEKYR